MFLNELSLFNYRNYSSLQKGFPSQINILIGQNAQGKTNLIEAIYYLSTGKTYRPARDGQLVKWNCNNYAIKGDITNNGGSVNIEITFYTMPQVSKEIKINGLKITRMAELLGNLTVVLFAPEDLSIIKGSPGERRKMLDQDISQVSPSYYGKLQKYNRLLNQRNHLLKNNIDKNRKIRELDIWNEQLIEVSEEIIQKRLRVLEKLTPLTRLMQRKLTKGQENLEIKYQFNKQDEVKIGDNIKERILEELERNKEEEIRRGITLWGPHRDDLLISLNGIDLKYYGSQGQHRTAVLAIKLAELEFFKAESGEYPLLLLDDVLSELDLERRKLLLNTIEEKQIQCFITTTDDISFEWQNDTIISKRYIDKGMVK